MLPDIVEIGQQLLLKHDKCPNRLYWDGPPLLLSYSLDGKRGSSSKKISKHVQKALDWNSPNLALAS